MHVSRTLNTIADCVALVRTLVQDGVEPYRYPDIDIVLAMDLAIVDMSRVRPDLFVGIRYENATRHVVAGDMSGSDPTQKVPDGINTVPTLTPAQRNSPRRHGVMNIPALSGVEASQWGNTPIPVPPEYRTALVYYATGHVQLRDDEVTQDSRASSFLESYRRIMEVGL